MPAQVWPPPNGLASHNVPHGTAVLTTYSSIKINATGEKIFDVLRRLDKYGNWNAFAPVAKIERKGEGKAAEDVLEVGDTFFLDVIMDPKSPSKRHKTSLLVTDLSTPDDPSTNYLTATDLEQGSYATEGRAWRISWKNIGMGPKTERVTEVVELDEGGCEHRTWECQAGLMARVVKSMYKERLSEAFEGWGKDLKRFVENSEADGGPSVSADTNR